MAPQPPAPKSLKDAETEKIAQLLEKKRAAESSRWASEHTTAPGSLKAAEARKVLGIIQKKHESQSNRRPVVRGTQADTEVRSQSFADFLASREKPSVNTGGIEIVSVPLSATKTWTTKDEIARGELVKSIEAQQKVLDEMDARKAKLAKSASTHQDLPEKDRQAGPSDSTLGDADSPLRGKGIASTARGAGSTLPSSPLSSPGSVLARLDLDRVKAHDLQFSKPAPSSSLATLPSSSSAGDALRRSERAKKRKADADPLLTAPRKGSRSMIQKTLLKTALRQMALPTQASKILMSQKMSLLTMAGKTWVKQPSRLKRATAKPLRLASSVQLTGAIQSSQQPCSTSSKSTQKSFTTRERLSATLAARQAALTPANYGSTVAAKIARERLTGTLTKRITHTLRQAVARNSA